jgi:hypothetical protein
VPRLRRGDFYKNNHMKNRGILFSAVGLMLLSPLTHADVPQVAHDVKDTTVHAVHKTGEVARHVGHATAHAAKSVGHGVANATRNGYHATKNAVHQATE